MHFSQKQDESYTAQKMKFSIKVFISKCDQIRGQLRIWSHLLQKSSIENFVQGYASLNDPHECFKVSSSETTLIPEIHIRRP